MEIIESFVLVFLLAFLIIFLIIEFNKDKQRYLEKYKKEMYLYDLKIQLFEIFIEDSVNKKNV